MAKKLMSFKTKGMNRDLSVSAFNPEFSFENHNLRLSTNEGNTLMSWVNEKGTTLLPHEHWEKEGEENVYENPQDESWTLVEDIIKGVPIGTAIINNQLVLFTHEPSEEPYGNVGYIENPDHIYVITYVNSSKTRLKVVELFNGDLNFDIEHPLETIVFYESDKIQKVYWADGKNQLRLINICKEPGYYQNPTDFDFSREINLTEDIRIQKTYGVAGEFPSGVIQYAFTYYNKNAQESNIFRVTPIQYITFSDRGGGADEKVNVAFDIYTKKLDTSYEYLRVYSIIRTSIDSVPAVKRIQDIKLAPSMAEDTWNYILTDTNLTGDVVDPASLLYMANKLYVIPQTIEQKDNTLFLGNLTYSQDINTIDTEIKEDILRANELDDALATQNVEAVLSNRPFMRETLDDLVWINTLRCPDNITDTNDNPVYYQGASCFKSGEYYRLGIQFQNKMGKWSEPCWIGDKQWVSYTTDAGTASEVTHYGPESYYFGDGTTLPFNSTTSNKLAVEALPEFTYTISASIQSALYDKGYRRMRAVYAQPTPLNRTILCQNIACPTMYRKIDRDGETVYAQSSWIFRAKLDLSNYYGYLDPPAKGEAGAVADKTYQITPTGGNEIHELGLPSIYSPRVFRGMIIDVSSAPGAGTEYKDKQPTGMPPIDGHGIRMPEWNSGPDVYDIDYSSAGMFGKWVWMPYYRSTEVMGTYDESTCFNIDNKTITLHSPDSAFDEFNSYIFNTDLNSVNYRVVGKTKLDTTVGNIDFTITTGSKPTNPNLGTTSAIKTRKIRTQGTSALISGNFYYDSFVTSESTDVYEPLYPNGNPVYWPLFMWHKKGSINNDCRNAEGDAILGEKIISNYRYSEKSIYTQVTSGSSLVADASEAFNETEDTASFTVGDYNYKGCVDMLLSPELRSDFYFVGVPDYSDRDYKNHGDLHTTDFPQITDLPVCKTHCVFFRDYNSGYGADDYDDNSFFFGIQFDDNSEDWYTSRNMPDTESGQLYAEGNGYRWNSWGDDYEKIGKKNKNLTFFKGVIPIKYKSTPHIVSILNSSGQDIYQRADAENLLMIDAYRTYDKNTLYGGYSDEALKSLTWIPCGPITPIDKNNATVVEYKWGDTYYQRYECLKTYAYTPEDLNQVVEIGSFMMESRVNLDGRYDKNRGTINMLYDSPQNFNLINPVYSQTDNFFNYKIATDPEEETDNYSNLITWTLTKESGADVDAWTNITLASTLELDGTCGKLNKLLKLNDQLLAFQDTGVSQILYNENTQISTTEGVPIEIANSGKVTGKRYFSNTVGCSNKYSITKSGTGVYFMDSNDKSIYLFNGQLTNLSEKFGFSTWCKQNIPSSSVKWEPVDFGASSPNKGAFVSYYDRMNQEVLFINKETALAFSEKVGAFTSFYDYFEIPFFCNLEDTGIWITSSGELWKHQAGEYCRFFDINYPYFMTLVGNPEPQTDKIFTNLEFRACVEGEANNNTIPFDSLETWNEYQHGIANLSVKSGTGAMQHNLSDKTASLNRKFRMWRCDIPRDNAELSTDAAVGVSRSSKHVMDRMRNSWLYMKLMKNAETDITDTTTTPATTTPVTLPKVEIHDLVMTYYN